MLTDDIKEMALELTRRMLHAEESRDVWMRDALDAQMENGKLKERVEELEAGLKALKGGA